MSVSTLAVTPEATYPGAHLVTITCDEMGGVHGALLCRKDDSYLEEQPLFLVGLSRCKTHCPLSTEHTSHLKEKLSLFELGHLVGICSRMNRASLSLEGKQRTTFMPIIKFDLSIKK